MVRLIVSIAFVILLSSCASIYNGKEPKEVKLKEVGKVDKSVTVRFILIGDTKYISDDKLWVSIKKCEFDDTYKYMEENSPFKEIKCDYSKVGNENNSFKVENIDDIPSRIPNNFETDYMADIYLKYPVHYHGSGTGTWGDLISFLTLGILPHYRRVEDTFTVYLRKKNDPERARKSFEYTRYFGVLSAIWLWIAPSSESMHTGGKLNKAEKSNAHILMREIVKATKADLE